MDNPDGVLTSRDAQYRERLRLSRLATAHLRTNELRRELVDIAREYEELADSIDGLRLDR